MKRGIPRDNGNYSNFKSIRVIFSNYLIDLRFSGFVENPINSYNITNNIKCTHRLRLGTYYT